MGTITVWWILVFVIGVLGMICRAIFKSDPGVSKEDVEILTDYAGSDVKFCDYCGESVVMVFPKITTYDTITGEPLRVKFASECISIIDFHGKKEHWNFSEVIPSNEIPHEVLEVIGRLRLEGKI